MKNFKIFASISILLILMPSCATSPGGIAASTTPINGREYKVLGNVSETSSRVALLGVLPISGKNSTRDAIESAIESKSGDAMINVTVDAHHEFWLLFTRMVTSIEGDVIKFEASQKNNLY